MAWYDFLKADKDQPFGIGNLSTTAKVLGGSLGAYGLANALGKADSLNKFLGVGGANTNQPVGYQGGIPEYTAQRTQLPMTQDPDRRPGSGGRRYFSDVTYTPTSNVVMQGVGLPTSSGNFIPEDELTALLGALTAPSAPVESTATTPTATTPTATTPTATTPTATTPTATTRTATTPTATTSTATTPTATTSTATAPKVTDADILGWLKANPSATDDQIAQIMDIYKVTPAQVAAATNADPKMVNDRYMNASIRSYLKQNPTATDNQLAQIMNQYKVTPQQVAAATGTPLSQVTSRYNEAMADINSGASTGFTDVKTPADVANIAKQYAADKDFSSGETSNLFTMAKNMNISPAAMASMLGVSEKDVVNHLRALYPHDAQSYLGKYGFARGGLASLPQSKGYYLGGATDGMADKIPARIDGKQEARLSDGEFVIDAGTVSALGNGNSKAGAQVLYEMMERVRQAAHGKKEQQNQIDPRKVLPV